MLNVNLKSLNTPEQLFIYIYFWTFSVLKTKSTYKVITLQFYINCKAT